MSKNNSEDKGIGAAMRTTQLSGNIKQRSYLYIYFHQHIAQPH
jgi:hypothetical protein